MTRARRVVFLALVMGVLVWPVPSRTQTGAKGGEWRAYRADEASTAYSPLDQVSRDTVKNLQVAWTWKFDNFGAAGAETITTETTPLMVDGVLYFTAGQRRTVVAANAGTGETLWTWRLDEGPRYDAAPRKVHRGVAHWTDGKEARIVVVTPGADLTDRDLDRAPGIFHVRAQPDSNFVAPCHLLQAQPCGARDSDARQGDRKSVV